MWFKKQQVKAQNISRLIDRVQENLERQAAIQTNIDREIKQLRDLLK